jgi:glycosyltransferase involved in cell wall biosynthesis
MILQDNLDFDNTHTTKEPAKPMLPVSAFIIAFNEEKNIKECIESVAFCDEVIVVDSYSTDNTAQIAEALGARVIKRKWEGYKSQKAFALQSTKNEWVLNLDADERVSKELRNSIFEVLEKEYTTNNSNQKNGVVGFEVNRVVFHLNRWWRIGGWYPEYRLRLFRKSFVTWGGVDPHEKPIIRGATRKLDGELYHYTYVNLADQFERLHKYSSLAAEEAYRMGVPFRVYQIFINPLLRTFKFYIVKRGYREGIAGLIVGIAEGYYTFMKYAKLWEMHFNERKKRV